MCTRPTTRTGSPPWSCLFDLVFVYGMTQVTAFMARDLTGWGILRGMVLMGMLWFGWTAYAWLGNQAKADEGPFGPASSSPWPRCSSSR
jgi:hypothetical protein